MNLKTLAAQIHNDNKAKGFWDEPRQLETICLLIISELSEALESERKNKFAKDIDLVLNAKDEDFKQLFLDNIKDSFEDEIADAFIRMLDFLGSGLDNLNASYYQYSVIENFLSKNIDEVGKLSYIGRKDKHQELLIIIRTITDIFTAINDTREYNIKTAICGLVHIANNLNFDLGKHIEAKLRYNRLRPYKHGKTF